MTTDLLHQRCVPCEGGVAPLEKQEIGEYMAELKSEWKVLDDKAISRDFAFKNFVETMKFINAVADIAEHEGHHPDMDIRYNKVNILLTTHAIGGLSVNDFILARKIEEVAETLGLK